MEITVPKRLKDIFPPKPVIRRAPHRTRSSIASGLLPESPEEEKSPTLEFTREELDMEMTVVCAGEFVKEVALSVEIG